MTKIIGIYKLTNTVNGKFYIGSSINCNSRRKVHFSKLRSNTHDNKHLQASFNKYGRDAFIFEVIRELPIDTLITIIEQEELKSILELKPKFNKTLSTIRIADKTGRRIAYTRGTEEYKEFISRVLKEACNTDSHKQNMSIATKKYYASLTNEQKAERNKHKVGKVISEETRAILSEKRRLYHANKKLNENL